MGYPRAGHVVAALLLATTLVACTGDTGFHEQGPNTPRSQSSSSSTLAAGDPNSEFCRWALKLDVQGKVTADIVTHLESSLPTPELAPDVQTLRSFVDAEAAGTLSEHADVIERLPGAQSRLRRYCGS
jgi:hypothetical protein